MNSVLYACIYIPEIAAQAVLRMRPDLRSRPIIILDGEPPLEFVCSMNKIAHKRGIQTDMTRIEAEAFSGVTVLKRVLATERIAKSAIMECATGFSPRIEDESSTSACTYVLDVAGMERLFGPAALLAKRIRARMQSIGFYCSIAISSNYHSALCTARHVKGIAVLKAGEERKCIENFPVDVLDLTQLQSEIFQLWGIRTLGSLAALPEVDLITRLGQEGKRLLQLAKGEYQHQLNPVSIALELKELVELEEPIELLDSLLFVLSPMLDHLISRARTRALSLAIVVVTVTTDSGFSHSWTIRPAVPTDNHKFLLKLIQLDLQSQPPNAPVLTVAIDAQHGTPSNVQLGLFAPQLPEQSNLGVTLARIAAMVGEDRIGSPTLKDLHQPDSFGISAFRIVEVKQQKVDCIQHPAVRRLRPEESITMQLFHGSPANFSFRAKHYMVERAWGPWLMSSYWWSEEAWAMQQWDIVAKCQGQATLFCRVVYDTLSHSWIMGALYD